MGKKKKGNIQTKFDPDHLEEKNIILQTLEEWKVFAKKNTWKKLFKQQTYKEGVIDSFCASFSNIQDKIVTYDGDDPRKLQEKAMKYRQFLIDSDRLAQEFAKGGTEYIKGWRMSKDWFRCMLVQLLLRNASVYDQPEVFEKVKILFEDVDFGDYRQYNGIKETDTTRVQKVYYQFKTPENGIITTHYNIILEQTDMIKVHSSYVSSTGRVWHVLNRTVDGLVRMSSYSTIDGDEVDYHAFSFTTHVLSGMKRIS